MHLYSVEIKKQYLNKKYKVGGNNMNINISLNLILAIILSIVAFYVIYLH